MINSLSNNYSYKEGEETTNYSSDLLQEIKHPSLDLKLGRKCPLQSQDRGEITNLFKENHGKKAIDLIGTCEPSFPDWKNEDVYEIIDYGGNVHIAKVDPSRQWMSEWLERKVIKSESGISWNIYWALILAWRLKSYYDATLEKQIEIEYK